MSSSRALAVLASITCIALGIVTWSNWPQPAASPEYAVVSPPAAPAAGSTAELPVPVSAEYLTLALQGDLRPMERHLMATPKRQLSSQELAVRQRFADRFINQSESYSAAPASPLLNAVMASYRDYWGRSLLGRLPEATGAEHLAYGLIRALGAGGVVVPARGADQDAAAHVDVLIALTQKALEAEGFYLITGRTEPLYELMVWRDEERSDFKVQLTDGMQPVTVVFMDDFIVKGWSEYATFGRAGTGGWATREALFCLRDDYRQDSEDFRVSYLKHEARHLADYRRYPSLGQIDLEYRAKLTELAFAEQTLAALLEKFALHGSPNPAAPHSYANFAVVRDLNQALFGSAAQPESIQWSQASDEQLRQAARDLLAAHTQGLDSAGASSVAGIVRSAP